MPRLAVCLNRHDPRQNFESSHIDVCLECWPLDVETLRAIGQFNNITDDELEEDIRSAGTSGAEHPSYDGSDVYSCAVCSMPLEESNA